MAVLNYLRQKVLLIFRKFIIGLLMIILVPVSVAGQSAINKLEYWLDNNFDGRTVLTVAPDQVENFKSSIDISSFPSGAHILSIRFRDESMRWSVAERHPFIKSEPIAGQSAINRLEYWLDNDFDGRTALAVTPDQVENFESSIDISSFPNGAHIVSIRFRDESKRWSVAERHPFIKSEPGEAMPTFTEAEMWIDERPVTGAGYSITASGVLIVDEAGDFSSVADGVHKLSFRAKDGSDRWSSLYSSLFIKRSAGTGGPGVVAYQYWVDDMSTELNTINIGSADPVLNLSGDINISGIIEGTYEFYIRFLDESGRWSVPFSKSFDRVSISTGVEKINGDLNAKIWPSPLTGDRLNMLLYGDIVGNAEIRIMDLTGKIRLTCPVKGAGGEVISLDLSQLGNGTYILLFKSGTKFGTAKLMILK
jgi:hypothetical protein